MRSLEESQKQKGEWWLPGAGRRGEWGGGVHLVRNIFSVLQDEESSVDKLHDNVNVLNTSEL